MIYIINGTVDEGKTGKMISIYRQVRRGDGFISQKKFAGKNSGDFIGYEIVRLSTGERKELARKTEHLPVRWDEVFRCGPYHFSKSGVDFAGDIIDDIISQGIAPIFIDEIGPLEIAGKGFAPLLKKALKTGKDIYLTVRNHCVEEVVKTFNIRGHRMIPVNKDDEKSDYLYFE